MITLKVRDFCTLVRQQCDNNTNPFRACAGRTDPERSSHQQRQGKHRAESGESEEEEQRFCSVLMLEPKSRKKRTDQIDSIPFHEVSDLIRKAECAVCCQAELKVSSST